MDSATVQSEALVLVRSLPGTDGLITVELSARGGEGGTELALHPRAGVRSALARRLERRFQPARPPASIH
jgi:hypothetical protein